MECPEEGIKILVTLIIHTYTEYNVAMVGELVLSQQRNKFIIL